MKRTSIINNHNHIVSDNKFDLNQDTLIGWFFNKYNPEGWSLHNLTLAEKKEFGFVGVYRTLNNHRTSIIKVDPEKGTYAFLDNSAYEGGELSFEKLTAYRKLVIFKENSFKYSPLEILTNSL